MIRPCYRTGSHDGALLALYEEYARLVDAEAAGAPLFRSDHDHRPPRAAANSTGGCTRRPAGEVLNGSARSAASGRLNVVPGLSLGRESAGGAGSVGPQPLAGRVDEARAPFPRWQPSQRLHFRGAIRPIYALHFSASLNFKHKSVTVFTTPVCHTAPTSV